jgi:hypothetical protein
MLKFQVSHCGPAPAAVPADRVMNTSLLPSLPQGVEVLSALGKLYYPAAPDQPAPIQLYVAGKPLALPEPRLGLNATEAARGAALLAHLTARIVDHLTQAGVASDIAYVQAGVIAGSLASDALLNAAAPLNETAPEHTLNQRAMSLTFEGDEVRAHLTATYTSASVQGTSKVEDLELTFTPTRDGRAGGDTHQLTLKMSRLAVRLHPALDIPHELKKFGVTQPSPLTSSELEQGRCWEWVEQVWARVLATFGYRTMRVEAGVPTELATPGAWTRPPGIALDELKDTEKYYLIAATPAYGPWSSDRVEYADTDAGRLRNLQLRVGELNIDADTDAGRLRNLQLARVGKLNIGNQRPMSFPGLSAAIYPAAEDRLDEIATECGAAELDAPWPPLLMNALDDALYQVYASPGGSVMIDGKDILQQVNGKHEAVRALVESGQPTQATRLMGRVVVGRLKKAMPGETLNARRERKRVLMALALAWRATQPVYDHDGAPQFKNNEGEVRTINIVTRTQAGEKFADGTVRLSFVSHHRDLCGDNAQVVVGGEARTPAMFERATMTSTATWWVKPVSTNETRERPAACQGIYLKEADYEAEFKLSPLGRFPPGALGGNAVHAG